LENQTRFYSTTLSLKIQNTLLMLRQCPQPAINKSRDILQAYF
jgi:hypothetical protein